MLLVRDLALLVLVFNFGVLGGVSVAPAALDHVLELLAADKLLVVLDVEGKRPLALQPLVEQIDCCFYDIKGFNVAGILANIITKLLKTLVIAEGEAAGVGAGALGGCSGCRNRGHLCGFGNFGKWNGLYRDSITF